MRDSIIDEIEAGLEPHRLRRLIRVLRDPSFSTPPYQGEPTLACHGQAIITTHSAVAIVELRAAELGVVRSNDGHTTVTRVPPGLQAIVRSTPEAFLAKRIVVCEGKTEVGVWFGLRDYWQKNHDNIPVEYHGTVAVCGDGCEKAPGIAKSLSSLGFAVLYFGDSDQPMKPSSEELKLAGVQVVLWAETSATEDRLARDLPVAQLQQLISLAVQSHGKESVHDAISHQLPAASRSNTWTIANWADAGISEPEMRAAFAKAAKKNDWYKRIDLGEQVAQIVLSCLSEISTTDLAAKLVEIEAWSYVD